VVFCVRGRNKLPCNMYDPTVFEKVAEQAV
jgi:hypothetical protein